MPTNLEFTNLHFWETDSSINMPVDEQIRYFVLSLKGELKRWQILAPTPNKRIIYFEIEGGVSKPEFVQGSFADQRAMMIGEKSLKKTRKTSKK